VKVGILTHCSGRNLGDEAAFAAVVQNIRNRYPDSLLLGFTINPESTEKLHGIPSYPLKRRIAQDPVLPQTFFTVSDDRRDGRREAFFSLLRKSSWLYRTLKRVKSGMPAFLRSWQEPAFLIDSYRALRQVDLLIIAGSHPIMDYSGGPWCFPYTLLKWVFLAKLSRVKVAFLSVGAGPMCTWLGRKFARTALNLAEYRSFRDKSSLECIEHFGIVPTNLLVPDLVFSFQLPEPAITIQDKPRPVVGLNPVPFEDPASWLGASPTAYKNYVNTLAEFALWLIQRHYDVFLFPTQLYLDPAVIGDIRATMSALGKRDFARQVRTISVASFTDLSSALALMDIVVATRFHGTIFSFLLNKPVLSISYHRKTADLMAQMGQSNYVIDIQSVTCEELRERFLCLERSVTVVKGELDIRVRECQQALEEQYRRVFQLG